MGLFLKLLLAVSMVLGLARIAERAGPAWAGIFSGAPLGVALVLLFYGIELGVEYAAGAAGYALLGLMAALIFAGLFVTLAPRFTEASPWPLLLAVSGFGVAACVLLALVQWLGMTAASGQTSLVGIADPFIPLVALLTALMALGVGLKLPPVAPPRPLRPQPLTREQQGARAAVVALMVVAITSLAHQLTPAAAGVLAGFPLVLFALMLVLQWHQGSAPVVAVVRHFPFGMGSLILYTLMVSLTYPAWGLAWGTAVSMGIALLYLLLLALWRRWRSRR